MQPVDIKLRNAKPDYFGSCRCSPRADPTENLALSSTIVRRPMGESVKTGVVASGIADLAIAIARPVKKMIACFVPPVAVLATVGKYGRFSIRYRMKVK